jgi:predicted nuclease of predicted toxin-antitoxin system
MNYLVDVNLPKYFSWFNQANFVFVADIDSRLTDTNIWNYALQNNLVILTRDTDFYHRIIASIKHPKVVYFDLGNVTLKQLHNYFDNYWRQIETLLQECDFIIATPSNLKVIK